MRELRPYLTVLARRRGRLAAGALLMLMALAAAVGLLSLSGWFITATAVTAAIWATGTLVAFDVYVPGGGIRFFALTRTVSRYLERLFNHDTVLRILADLRGGMFAALARLDPGTLSRYRAAELLNRLTADINTLDNLYLRLIAPPLAALAGALAVAGLLGIFLPMAGLALGGLLMALWLVLTLGCARWGAAVSAARVGTVETLRVRLIEQLQGLAELTAYGSLAWHRARVDDVEAALLAGQRRLGRRTAAGSALATLGVQGGMALVLLLAVAAFSHGLISAPVMVLLPLAVLGLGEAFISLPAAFLDAGATRESARRLNAQGRLRSATPSPTTPVQPVGNDLALDRVTFRYARSEAPVLASATLRIAEGERIALVGASGSGKSTVAQLFARLLDADDGQVLIGGVAVSRIAPAILRRRVAYLTQASELFHDTVAGNLRIADPDAPDERLMAALRVAGLERLVAALPDGLETWLGESGRTLSGGEARRLALARVVLRDAPVVLLDEPFAGLDAVTAAEVAERLGNWLRGRTVLLLAHETDRLPALDRMLRIGASRVVEV